MAHCMPLLDRPRSCWIVGAAIDTMVWSMKVIATAKIIAVRIRLFDRTPPPVVMELMDFLLDENRDACARAKRSRHRESGARQLLARRSGRLYQTGWRPGPR